MKFLAATGALLAAAVIFYALWHLQGVETFWHGDAVIQQHAHDLDDAKDISLLRLSAGANADLAYRWSQVAGKYMLLFYCSLVSLAFALLAVAVLAYRSANQRFKPTEAVDPIK